MNRLNDKVLGTSETRGKECHICRRTDRSRTYNRPSPEEMYSGILPDRSLVVKLKGNPFNISVIFLYALSTQSTEE